MHPSPSKSALYSTESATVFAHQATIPLGIDTNGKLYVNKLKIALLLACPCSS